MAERDGTRDATQSAWRERGGVIHRVRSTCQGKMERRRRRTMTDSIRRRASSTTDDDRLAGGGGDPRRPRGRAQYAHQGRPVAGDGRRRGVRGHHPRGRGAAAAGRAGRLGRGAAPRAAVGAIGDEFILVDPLDGTRELVAGRDEFTDQSGAGARRPRRRSGSSRRRRSAWSGARPPAAAPSGCGSRPGAPAERRDRAHRDPDPADAEGRRRRRGQPLAFRCRRREAFLARLAARRRGMRRADRRSSSAGSPRARPTSIRGSRRPISGTWRPATRRWRRPAASSPRRTGVPLSYRPTPTACGFRASSPGAIRRPPSRWLTRDLGRQRALDRRPVPRPPRPPPARAFAANIALFSGV